MTGYGGSCPLHTGWPGLATAITNQGWGHQYPYWWRFEEEDAGEWVLQIGQQAGCIEP